MNRPESCEKLPNTTAAFREFMACKGVDLGYGRGLGGLLLKCGFKNVRADGAKFLKTESESSIYGVTLREITVSGT